jgi:SAM-dependent methyltransferase
LLNLDGLIAYAAANISNPLIAPVIVMSEIETGSLLFTGKWVSWNLDIVADEGLSAFTFHSLVGALVVAFTGACIGAVVTLGIGLVLRGRQKKARGGAFRQAFQKTLNRYRDTRPRDKHYVYAKLLTDPLTRQLEQLKLNLGHVTDIGCGRGQFALFLVVLGKAQSVDGFDWDPTKIESATRAAGHDGHFVTADLREPPLHATDTVLLFDVLHYLSAEDQRRLLGRCFAALRPGGYLLLRDVDKNHGLFAVLTRLCEHIGTRLRMNRSAQLVFRSSEEIRRELFAIGFELELAPSQPKTLLDNQLWVFRKPTTVNATTPIQEIRTYR